MGAKRIVSRSHKGGNSPKMKATGASTRGKSPRNTPGEAGNGPAKNPQRTMQQAKGGMGASLQKGRRKR